MSNYPQPSPAYAVPLKDTGTAYLWALGTFFGVAGLQHLYLGKPWKAILWFLTWGLFGVGTVFDLFTMRSQTQRVNHRLRAGIR